MSSRALRRLKGEQRAQAALQELELSDEERMKSDTHQLRNNISNIFELVHYLTLYTESTNYAITFNIAVLKTVPVVKYMLMVICHKCFCVKRSNNV